MHFCNIHKNNISINRCYKCSREMCKNCTIEGSNFCPKCRGTNILKIEKKHSQNEIRNILIVGFVLSLISLLMSTFTDISENISQKHLILNSLFLFALGISFSSAFYFVKKTDTFDELLEIPFLGKKIIKYIIIGSSIIGIPMIYFIYLIINYLKKKT